MSIWVLLLVAAVLITFLLVELYRVLVVIKLRLRGIDTTLETLSRLSKGRNLKVQQLNRETQQIIKNLAKGDKNNDLTLYRQIEALLELNSKLGFNISGLRHWAICPDEALLLYKTMVKCRPETVVDLGSGLSSVIIAQALKINGKGRLISIDHLPEYAEKTSNLLKQYDLNHMAEVRVAPLKKMKNGKANWYDPAIVKKGIQKIDFLLVDGPPGKTNKNARQPAVPMLKDLFSEEVIIFLDDYNRTDERTAAQNWQKLLPNHALDIFETEKGTAVLRPLARSELLLVK